MANNDRRTQSQSPRIPTWIIAGMAIVFWDCGGDGELPLAASAVNAPPVVVRVEVVGVSQVAWGATAPISADVRDPDGDTVTCRWTARTGRVLVESDNTCKGVYYAPMSGESERLDVVPTDSKGATGGAGSLAFPLVQAPVSNPNPTPTARPEPSPAAPTPKPEPQPAPTPTPGPAPTPTPGATPTPQPNRPPTVTVSASNPSCHPRPGAPCSIPVQANASDPDGDPLTFTWQGCAAGAAATSSCSVSSLAGFTATVTVSDPKGATATASVTMQGTNSAPSISGLSAGKPCHPNCNVDFVASASDPDGDPLTYNWGGCATGTDSHGTCSLTDSGTFGASVTVSDGWAGASASGSATGTNRSGSCSAGDPPAGSGSTGFAWDDPDRDPLDHCSATCEGCTITHCRSTARVEWINGDPGDRITITACDRFSGCGACSLTLQ